MHPKTQKAVLMCFLWSKRDIPENFGKTVSLMMINDLFSLMSENKWTISEIMEYRSDFLESFSDIVMLRSIGHITAKHSKQILSAVWETPYLDVAKYIIDSKLLEEADETSLINKIKELIENNSKIVTQYKNGKTNIIGSLVGQTLKAFDGKADPKRINEIIIEQISRL